ncbi:MAG TPA: cytochrome c oxidase subunit II [Solirubrobacteraceae bacterium]|jgi:cytochrome c oxidase subunit 2
MPAALRRRHVLLLAVLAVTAAGMVLAPGAMASAITLQHGGSPNADRINSLYVIALVLGLVVFLGVEGALLYSIVKFRAKRGAVAAQIRGNTPLEIGWTVGAAVILVILSVITFAKLGAIRDPENSGPNGLRASDGGVLYATSEKRLPPNGKSLNICINGQQYVWRFTYNVGCNATNPLDAVFSYEEMVVPTDTTVTLDIVSQDVAHSWWIPQLGGKFDAVPGYTNHTWFKIPKPGVYAGQCAELCGRNHANMVARVRAVPPAQFETWLSDQKLAIQQADQAAAVSRQRLNANPNANP